MIRTASFSASSAVFLAVMPGVPATAVVAALLVWRLLYLLLPLALAQGIGLRSPYVVGAWLLAGAAVFVITRVAPFAPDRGASN